MADVVQRSAAWFAVRAGKITGSRFVDATAFSRDGKKPLAARTNLMRVLAFERLAGIPRHEVGAKALAWGTECEPYLKEAYEIETGLIITEAPFVTHPIHEFVGCSADGFVGDDGLIEGKCPHDEAVHIGTWLEGVPEDHMPQIQGNLWVTGRKWLDFVSYDARQAEPFRLYVKRVPRDEEYISVLATGVLQFEAELRQMVSTLKKLAGVAE